MSLQELRGKCQVNGLVIDAEVPIQNGFKTKLRRHVKNGATIVTIGGDGTISAVAALVAGSDAVLAPLPGGTLNHFTKDCGIPQDIDEALAALKTARIRRLDVAAVNGMVFVNNSSIGLYPSSLRERSRHEGALGKWPAAVIAGVRTLVQLPSYAVTVDDETFHTPFIFMGNNTYDIAKPGTPVRKRLDGGVLSVFMTQETSRLGLLKIALFSLVGRAHTLEEFDVRSAHVLTIASKHSRLNVSHDGEVDKINSPLHYEIRPRSLRVLG